MTTKIGHAAQSDATGKQIAMKGPATVALLLCP
jgi:hypothetical protein